MGSLRRLLAVSAVLTSFLAPLAASGTAQAAAATVNAVRLNGYEAALITDINRTRGAHGLRSLIVVPGATDVARRWSWHLASVQTLSHNPYLVSNLEHSGSSAWTMISENVGTASATSPGTLFTAYMNSAPHRANILDPSAVYVGVGVVQRGVAAWNTLDFTNAYSSTYGITRVPADGMTLDTIAVTTTRTLASFESRYDERTGTGAVSGVSASLAHYTGPTTGDDRVYATFVQHTTTGHGDLILRDAWSLASAQTISVKVAIGDPAKRTVAVQVILGHSYGSSVSLGTISVRGVASSFTLALPAAARTFMDTLTFRVQSSSLGSAGGSAVLSVYNVNVNV